MSSTEYIVYCPNTYNCQCCPKRRYNWKTYCKNNKCLEPQMNISEYCILHTCITIGCYKERIKKRRICICCWIKNEYLLSKDLNYFQILPIEIIVVILNKIIINVIRKIVIL